MSEHYIFEGCDTVDLAREFGTPLYVVSEDAITARIREVKAAFDERYERAHTHYASKAFLTRDMIRIASREGLGLDVVSGGELYGAISTGFPASRITFHGNDKTSAEIDMALESGVGRFACDSVCEIELLARKAREHGVTAKALIRVTPGVNTDTHEYISTAMADSKFGVPLAEIGRAVDMCLETECISLTGFHFHVGSQIVDNASHLMATDIVLDLIKRMRGEKGFETMELDLGGGFGIRYADTGEPKPIRYFIDPMVERVERFCSANGLYRPDLMIEPGRWIVGEAGITLYTVGSVKEVPGIRKYAAVDGGMPDNPRPALYRAEYEAVAANKFGEAATETVTIAGRCCESGDILIRDLRAPALEPGDILAVKSTGAYCYSMASNYNKVPVPAIVAIKDGVPRISVRRQTYEELYERDC